MSDKEMEKEIVELGLTAPRVTPDHINNLLLDVDYYCHVIPNTTITQVTALLDGFSICTVEMACVSPENFNKELGEKYGIEKCKKAASDKLWELEGYILKRTGEVKA